MRSKASAGRGRWVLAGRLALVIAALLAVRQLSDRYDTGGIRIPDGLGQAVLAMELPGARWPAADGPEGDQPVEPSGGSLDLPEPAEPGEPVAPSGPPADPNEPTEPAEPADPAETGEPQGDPGPSDEAPAESPGVSVQPETAAIGTTITGAGGGYTDLGDGIYVKNRTDYELDAKELLKEPLAFTESSAVLIVHTHGSEAYNPAGEDIYVPSDPSRTEDKRFNVVRVGDELEKLLTERGITVYHDRELHDYPSYAGSYERTLTAIKAQLSDHPEISVVIDLHRDALEGDGKVYKTVADVGDTPSAQVMLICGSDFSGLKHPNWRENLSFAMKLQRSMVTKYPTLARPLKLSEYRYNQHATTGSLIAEVGTNGNTLQEALTAVRYFGDCLADVLTGS